MKRESEDKKKRLGFLGHAGITVDKHESVESA